MSDEIIFSRCEKRLRSEVTSAVNVQERHLKRAELAAYQGRIGRFDLARLEIDRLRKENSEHPSIRVSISVHIAEGLFKYFSGVGIVGDDSVERAYALSVAGGQLQLQALSAAWLAQWEYSRFNFDALWRYVTESLRLATPDNAAAASRAYLVGAQALHFAGRADLSKDWYRRSHEIASRAQDDATVSAILHNTSWLQMLNLRQAVLAGTGDRADGRQALLNAQSTANFDLLHGKSSWDQLKPLLRAQITSLVDKSGEALTIYLANTDEINAAGRLRSNLSADVAWCFLRQNRYKEAFTWAKISEENLSAVSHLDDLASTHSTLSLVYDGLSIARESANHGSAGKKLWDEHIAMQKCILDLFDKYSISNISK